MQLSSIFDNDMLALPSAAACSVKQADTMLTPAKPYCVELPQVILDVAAAEPSIHAMQDKAPHTLKSHRVPSPSVTPGAGLPRCKTAESVTQSVIKISS
jgi:hypothetical protein